MNAARSVGATFTRQTFTLTVGKTGTGSGTVTSGDGLINCGATCSATYNSSSVVSFTDAAASEIYSLTLRDALPISGTSCTVTMNAARSVGATFTRQTFT